MILQYFLTTFETACVQLVGWIPFVFGIWLLFDFIGSLLFNKK